ncbi:MAG: restriction endonuclease [Terracidiphilus sp.]|jgi:restriction endonuclease Mrr
MPDPSPDTVAFWVSRDITNESFRTLLDITTIVLVSRLVGKSAEECADLAEKVLPKLVSALESIRAESLEDGVEPSFELSVEQNALYIKAVSSDASRFLNRLHALTWQEFEQFCGRILGAMGGKPTVTGKPGDGGIDFIAKDLPLCSPAPKGARITIVGQAKKYGRDNLVIEQDIRSFIGGAVRRTSDPEDPHCFRRNILAPVSFAFWTTSDFQPSARKFARGLGLWYLNGIALSQLAIRLNVELNPADPDRELQ